MTNKDMTICIRCKKEKRQPHQRYCKGCHNAYMREWRKTHKLTPSQRHRDRCRGYAHIYYKRGLLLKEPCQICGDPNSQMHHDDYNHPLDVKWLCRKHHIRYHRLMKIFGIKAKNSEIYGKNNLTNINYGGIITDMKNMSKEKGCFEVEPNRIYSLSDAAYIMGVTPRCLKNWINEGIIYAPLYKKMSPRILGAEILRAFSSGVVHGAKPDEEPNINKERADDE